MSRVIQVPLTALALWLLAIAFAQAAEPEACLSENPNDWPLPARPYFLVIADTSGSMTSCTNPASTYPESCNPATATPNSCGLLPTRYNDLKCALEKVTSGYSGQARFGLSTFAAYLDDCSAGACIESCSGGWSSCPLQTYQCNAYVLTGDSGGGCGLIDGSDPATRQGSILRVPIARDSVGETPQEDSNARDLLAWVDGICDGGEELFAGGSTPLNGALRDAKRYFASGLLNPLTDTFFTTPLDANDRPCRSVNVILITDGDETCDSQANAVAAAQDLFQNGVDIGEFNYKVRVHVLNLVGGTQANTDAIAAAGGTGSSLYVANEVQLAQALSGIVAGAIGQETCDNRDNNCNGCTDEGFRHFANIGQACCTWSTPEEREGCLDRYRASIIASPPEGDLSALPCATLNQQKFETTWLCHDPGEICDGLDNNGLFGIDENQLKCGDPEHCPQTEICNNLDDDCDGLVDEGEVCGGCKPAPEVCDGCDNDCDGIIDNGVFPLVSCGLDSPEYCGQTLSCAFQTIAFEPGECQPGQGYGTCVVAGGDEVCDGEDNDCDGLIDEDLPPVECVPDGVPGDLVYGGDSQCRKGIQYCGQECTGFMGPTLDVTDGIDNNCDGIVDNTPSSFLDLIFGDGFEQLLEMWRNPAN